MIQISTGTDFFMSAVPSYLISRNGIWYFNYRIPSFIRTRYSIQNRFIRKSLRTAKVREAVRLVRKYDGIIMGDMKKIRQLLKNSELTEEEKQVEILDDAMVIGRNIIEAYEATEKYGTYNEKNDFWIPYSEYEIECCRYASENIIEERKQKEREKENKLKRYAKILANEVKNNIGNNVEPENQKSEKISITLNELIKQFIKYKQLDGTWKPRTLKLQNGRLGLIREFLEYAIGIENPMIHLFKSDHAIMFEEEFCHYPKNCKKHFPDMSLAEVMTQIDSFKFVGIDRISTNNYNEYAQLLMAIFKWAKEDKKRKYLTGENVFVDLKKTGEAPKSYSPFTNDEIKLFFGTDIFKKKTCKTQYAWRYWIPVIMLYHGMRLEEVAQLLVKNIFESNGVWCFDIRDEIDEQGRIITTTKKRGKRTGERIVPIHHKVKDIGFLEYVQYQKDSGSSKVFPTLKNFDKNGEYKQAGASVTAWFNEDSEKQSKTSYFTSVGIDKKKRNLVLYSFKYSAETLLINHPDKIEHDKIDTMIGHLIKSTGRKHYGKYNEKTLLEDVVEKIEYPEAELPWDVDDSYGKIKFSWE